MDIVAKLRGALADKLGKERYDLWFDNDAWMTYVNGTVRIEASQPFIIERLRMGFRTEITAAIAEVFGGSVPVEFCVAPCSASTDKMEKVDKPVEPTLKEKVEETDRRPTGADDKPTGSTQKSRPTASRQMGRRFLKLKSFVVGGSNQIAFKSAQLITSRLGEISPLFIHGPTGTGKTHLLEGIWSEVRRQDAHRKIVYLSAEQFTSYFLEALRGSGLPSFRRKYRQLDMLLIDDLQFFVGKRATVVELLHTTDNLLRQGRQVVFAADRPAAELPYLGSDLTARLTGGLVCQIQPLDVDTQKELLRRLARERSVPMSPTVIDLLARTAPGDARQLSGAVNRLMLTSDALGRAVDTEMVQSVIGELFPASRKDLHLADIERAVCATFDLTSKTLHSEKKTRGISHPRMLAMWLARKYTRAALSEISEYFGRRSHTTVLSAQKKVNRWIEQDSSLEVTSHSCSVRDVVRKLEDALRVG